MTMIFDVSISKIRDEIVSYQSSKISCETIKELFEKVSIFESLFDGIIDNVTIQQYAKKERERKTKDE